MTKEKKRSILGQNIVSRRRARGWSQEKLAEKAGVSIGVIKKIELGPKEGSPEAREAVARALGCTVSDLYREASAPPPEKQPEISPGEAKILEILEKRLPVNFKHGKEAEIDNLKAQIRELRELIGPHKALLKRLQDALPIEIEAIYRALKVPREDAQAKKKGEAG